MTIEFTSLAHDNRLAGDRRVYAKLMRRVRAVGTCDRLTAIRLLDAVDSAVACGDLTDGEADRVDSAIRALPGYSLD